MKRKSIAFSILALFLMMSMPMFSTIKAEDKQVENKCGICPYEKKINVKLISALFSDSHNSKLVKIDPDIYWYPGKITICLLRLFHTIYLYQIKKDADAGQSYKQNSYLIFNCVWARGLE